MSGEQGKYPIGPMRALFPILLSVILMATTSCGRNQPLTHSVTIRNDSANHLDWVSVEWDGSSLRAGVVPPRAGKTYLDHVFPTNVATNVAIIKFIDESVPGLNWESGTNDEVRKRREQGWTRIPIDVSRLLKLGPERCHVTFQILSSTKVEVLVEKFERQ